MLKKHRLIGLLVFFLFFFITRLMLIEKDIPPMDISGYAQVDECYYVLPALDKLQYGDFYFNYNGKITSHSTFLGSSTLLNVLCFFSLKLFGNNYWGMRLTSVSISFGFLLLLLYLFRRIKENDNHQYQRYWPIEVVFLLVIVSDFSFIFSNIVVEPTLVRMFILIVNIVIAYHFLSMAKIGFSHFLFLGFFSILSWLFIYLTNFFIPCTIGILIIINSVLKRQSIVRGLIPFFLGSLLGLFIIFAYASLFKISLLNEFTYIYDSFSDRTTLKTDQNQVSSAKKIIINGFNFFKANFLNYNPLLLVFFLVCLFSYSLTLIQNKDERRLNVAFISLVFLIVFFLQSLLVNDFFIRKILITFPLYLIIAYHVFSHWIKGFEEVNNKTILIVVLPALVITLSAQLTQNWIYRCYGTEKFRSVIPPLLLGVVLLVLLILLAYYCRKIPFLIKSFLTGLIIINLYYAYSFAYKDFSTEFKDNMVAVGKIVGEKYLVGGWSIAFRLYNSSRPLLNQYRYYDSRLRYEAEIKKIISENKASYIITDKNDTLIKKFNLTPVKYILDYKCGDELELYRIDLKGII